MFCLQDAFPISSLNFVSANFLVSKLPPAAVRLQGRLLGCGSRHHPSRDARRLPACLLPCQSPGSCRAPHPFPRSLAGADLIYIFFFFFIYTYAYIHAHMHISKLSCSCAAAQNHARTRKAPGLRAILIPSPSPKAPWAWTSPLKARQRPSSPSIPRAGRTRSPRLAQGLPPCISCVWVRRVVT